MTESETTDLVARIGAYWENAAKTYEQARGHHPQTALEWAAWRGVLARLLPPPPARVLDVGAGTGILALSAAQLGHTVTAVDLAPAMLERLAALAAADGLEMSLVHARADELPDGAWDVVASRHLLWTLPDPGAALRCWRAALPSGRLVLLDSLWGAAAGPAGRGRMQANGWLRQIRGNPHAHNGHYDQELRDALPFGGCATPEQIVDLVTAAGWRWPCLERLGDVEWAMRRGLPMPDQVLGVNPSFAVTAR